ncbi:hypothetical protein BCR41DRAFT_35464 [Lobosporangium transversale]|uniref:Uncharacterized protein n=1 Tax=Lobosporangium transversale TaxID=64571 RepID=A0A1Y2GRE6_9FUNG|nr:hypothetical protein BCR41DRAFT_35464 [Lobosporangium transversale]ORZ20096.1 hypothetical protein BCR41DRAFT_35464 [Lobosporangium transversale]|eukprot:XP_021882636.1 hypothetical protein BCR41DRAFT_35464 [Lobosporangium transversale]
MLAAPEPLKLFGKAGNSSLGPSFTSGDSLSFSTLRNRTALDRFQQLKQSNANLSDSMSASQLITKEQQQAGCSTPLAIATGHLNRQSAVSDMGPNSSSGALFSSSASSNVNRHSQSFSHQPPTPSPLHSEIPVHPQSSSQPLQSRSTAGSNSSGIRRQSWLIGGSSSSVGSASGPQQDNYLKGLNVGSIAFRHGSLDQRRSILDMEEAMDRMTVATPEGIAFGSFPEDVHHQHSLYSAPLDAERDRKSLVANIYPILDLPFGPDPRPIPSHMSGEITNSSRPNRLLRLNNGLNGTGFTLPRLRTRAPDDNEPLNEVNPTDIGSSQRGERDSHGDDDEDEDEEGDIQEIGLRGDRSYKHEANTCINDDDDMLFIMSELSPTSNFGQEPIMTAVGGSHDRAMLPLTGAMLNLRSQSQSPSLGPHGGSSNGGTPSSSSPHLRIFGRNTIGHSGSNVGAAESNNNNSASNRSGSAHHSRVGSSSGSNTNNHNSFENLGLLRRPGSGSGFVDDFNLPSASSTPPPFPGFVAGASIGTFDAVLEGRQMSRGGSERDIGSGANSGGHNSFHSDSRGGRIEGW